MCRAFEAKFYGLCDQNNPRCRRLVHRRFLNWLLWKSLRPRHDLISLVGIRMSSAWASHWGSKANLTKACLARSAIVGIPRGRFSGFPGFGIQIRLTGLLFSFRFNSLASFSLCVELSDLTPSIPAVFLPLLIWVTLLTASSLALCD